MAYALLVLAQIVGLLLIPFGLPGTWLQVAALVAFGWATDFSTVGAGVIVFVIVLALAAELLDFWLGAKFARRFGGGRRAEWGAILGGIAGALVGLPVPLVGSVVGAFAGAFVGATVAELTGGRQTGPSFRAGWGAFLGRVAGIAARGGIAAVIAATVLLAAWR
jgi:uncharacterized protein